MDRRRRRYVPGPEGLEGRSLLSLAAPPAAPAEVSTGAALSSAASEAETDHAEAIKAEVMARFTRGRNLSPAREQALEEAIDEAIATRLQRIDRLPDFLRLLDPDRALPEPAIEVVQAELGDLLGALRAPAEPVAESYLEVLQDTLSKASISPATVHQLNNATSAVLRSAGAPEATVERLVAALTELAHADVGQDQPVQLLANDYALVLQTALGVGRPIVPALGTGVAAGVGT